MIVSKPKIWKKAVRRVFEGILDGTVSIATSYDPYVTKPIRELDVARHYCDVKTSHCPCGRRHVGKRTCAEAKSFNTITYRELVPKGEWGRCPFCPAQLKNDNSYTSHLVRDHSYIAPEAFFAPPSGVCPACLTCHHSRARLLYHVAGRHKKGTVCSLQCAATVCPYTVDEVRELQAEAPRPLMVSLPIECVGLCSLPYTQLGLAVPCECRFSLCP